MDTKDIIVLSAVVAVAGVRIYMKFFKKNQGKSFTGQNIGSPFSSLKSDEDYEPYSKNKYIITFYSLKSDNGKD